MYLHALHTLAMLLILLERSNTSEQVKKMTNTLYILIGTNIIMFIKGNMAQDFQLSGDIGIKLSPNQRVLWFNAVGKEMRWGRSETISFLYLLTTKFI